MGRSISSAFATLLVLFGAVLATPALAADPPPLAAYGDLPDFEDAAISPSGSNIAIVARDNGVRKLMMFDRDLRPTRSMAVDDLKIRSIEWIGDEAVLMITSQTEALDSHFTTNQAEFTRGIVVPVSPGKDVGIVFAKNRTLLDALYGHYGVRRVDGNWVGYFGGIRLSQRDDTQEYALEHTRPSLIEVDFTRDGTRLASREARENSVRRWLVDAQGEVAATLDVRTESGDWEILGPRGDRVATGHHPRGAVGLVALGREGTSIIYSAEDEAGYRTLFEVPSDGRSAPAEILTDEPVVGIYTDQATSRLIGYLRRGTTDEQVFFDPAKQQLAAKIRQAFKGRTVRIAGWTPDFSRLLVRTSGNRDSGTWFLIEGAELKANYIGIERPAIAEEQVGPISTFAYTAQDGLGLDGILTLPPGREAKSLPVVIMPHGGPSGHDEEVFDWWAQAYASRGYAVFQPNFRGSTNRDQDFERAGHGQWGRKMQTDVSDGLNALAEKSIVDPARACIVGASYGGYAALAGVTVQQGFYRCAVSVAGVSDLSMFFRAETEASGLNPMVKVSLLEELGLRTGFDEVSPRRLAARADAPILLIHGRDDTVVPFEQSERMADALRNADKPYELTELRDEDHYLSRATTRRQMLAAAVAFVEKHNPAD